MGAPEKTLFVFMNLRRHLAITGAALLLSACSGGGNQDLYQYMNEVQARPAGEIEPVPVFPPYQPFRYTAAAMRSPFDAPLLSMSPDGSYGRTAVEPDESRRKEYLESVNFAALSMVGTITKDGVIWALINDGQGSIHRVTVGNYLGKNHGRIVALNKQQVDVKEIVPDGKNGWVERPRTLALKEN